MTTIDKIQEAIKMMNEHDWWWAWAEYCTQPRIESYSHMKAFVRLVSSINDAAIISTLREMWVLTSKKAWTDNKNKQTEYENQRMALMATLPTAILQAA